MADLAASAVTVVRSWPEGGTSGKDRIGALLTLVLTGQGGATNKITASALGFTKIESCGNLLDVTNTKVYPAVPNTDGSAILVADAADGTATAHIDAADLTTTARIEVHGYR